MTTRSPSSLLFVLGIQRSGTTWLANILDSSADTLLFMEPFAPAYALFPELPETAFFLDASPPEINRLLREQMLQRLYRKKFLFSERSLDDPNRFRLERAIARTALRLSPCVPFGLRQRALQFTLLNLNRMDASHPIHAKRRRPETWVIKALRLAGKIPLLLDAYPDARYLVIIRSPHGTVHSMLRWFSKGSLGEVKRDLDLFVELLEAQQIGSAYRSAIAATRRGDIAHRAALYWRVSYETMAQKLVKDARFMLLPYEALARDCTSTVADVLRWAEIPWSDAVGGYLQYSSRGNTENAAATNTVRHSATHYASWQETIAPAVRHAVDEIVDGSFLLDCFRPYYATAEGAAGGSHRHAG